ncbi:MAG: 50S ribosomal protein L32 [bacterium]|nr:50S ribosomal protein L32 [bacterium]
MAVPKKRRSKSKSRTRRAHWKIDKPSLRACPSCGVLGHSHRACLECGQYKGRQVIKIKTKEAAATE